MKSQIVFSKIDQLENEYLQLWKDICNIESPTNYKEGVDAVGAYFIERAKKMGWDVTVHEEKVSGNALCITMNPTVNARPFCLSGHMDTVHPVGLFGSPAVTEDEAKLYGPGVADCKGGLAASFLAMHALQACGYSTHPIKLLLQSDEEISSFESEKRTIGFICEQSKDALAFFNCEAYKKNRAVLLRKGIMGYRFDIFGKAIHASNCYDGVSAVAEAAHKILEIEKWKDKDGITCNCGLIEGGTARNTVPEKCSFMVDIRFSNYREKEQIQGEMQRISDTSYIEGTTCKLTLVSQRLAMERKQNNLELLERMNEIYLENGLPVLECGSSNGGSDAADVTNYGIPCVDSLGAMGGAIHSVNEYAYKSSLAESAKRLASVIWCWDK